MASAVHCPKCNKAYRWRPELASRMAQCVCGEKLRFPATEPVATNASGGTKASAALTPGAAPTPTGAPGRHTAPKLAPAKASPPVADSSAPKRWSAGTIGVAVLGAGVVITLLVLSTGGGDAGMPASAGKQSQSINGVDFYSFDGDTDLDLVKFGAGDQVGISREHVIKGIGNVKLFVAYATDHWVFLWHNKNHTEGVQGIRSGIARAYLDAELGRSTDLSQFWPPYRARPYQGPGALSWNELLAKGFDYHHVFGAQTSGRVYVATVRHPVDEASRQRARAFIDEAIGRPRALHHAQALATLMRACGDMDNPKWEQWLRTIATTSAKDLVAQTQPADDTIVTPVLMQVAARARAEAAVTLALTTGFKETRPMSAALSNRGERELTLAILLDAIFGLKDEALHDAIRTYGTKQRDPSVRNAITGIVAQLESGPNFGKLLSSEPIGYMEAIQFDHQAREATTAYLKGKRDGELDRKVAMQVAERIRAEPIESQRMPHLFGLLRELDSKEYITSTIECLERAQDPWPQWLKDALDLVAAKVSGSGGAFTSPVDGADVEHTRQYVTRLKSIAQTLPGSRRPQKESLSRILAVCEPAR